jgi:Putative regulator of cell autolysis
LISEPFEDILIYFSKSLLGKENEDDILWDLAKNCIAKLGFVDCVIYILDHDSEILVQKAAYGPKSPKDKTLFNHLEIALGSGITGVVAQTGVAEIISNTAEDPRYIMDDDNRLSEICVPIAHENIVYGVIDCEHPEVGFFSPHHLKMLTAVASICAIKIKSVRANNELTEKKDKLLKIREEMLELKLRALNSQLNPHFVFNSLNAIQYFVTSEKKIPALEYLSTFSRLMRFYLKQLDKDTVSLYNEIDMLHWYLKLQKLRYDDSFEYTITLEKNSDKLEEAIIPAFIIHTLFENIIEHSMFNHHKGQHFNIVFKASAKEVIVDVEYRELDSDVANQPEYRNSILKWQDQIELLNTVKGYAIQNQSLTVTNGTKEYRKTTLTLPNLM